MNGQPISPEALAGLVGASHQPGSVLVVGLTGSVAAGKSTLATALSEALRPQFHVELVATDGFLFPNAVLEARGLLLRKGFPESYDLAAMRAALSAARTGVASIPAYSHSLYDIDPALSRTIVQPDILLVEGLGFAPTDAGEEITDALDRLVYLDAEEADLEHWFLERFMRLWHAAPEDPASFYNNFRHMSEAEARDFARTAVWEGINLPNLRNHISRVRPRADILVHKARDHGLELIRPT